MARHQATGSRLGYAGVLEVTATDGNRDGRGPSLSGADYHDERYWRSMQPTMKDAASAADDDTQGETNGQWRTDERRVGKECVSKCRYRWWRIQEKKHTKTHKNNVI